MIEKLLHTPQGMRDIYGFEWKRKDAVTDRLHHIFRLFGYQDISTPAFEFFDVFNNDTGTVSSRQMYKFFDRNNNTLVLRPDMTPSIARSVAKYYSDCPYPLRLSYLGNSYLNHEGYQGKLTEKTEIGAEYINDDSPEADAEALVMMIQCFLSAGLKEFCVDIGDAGFYSALMEELPVSDEVKEKIHENIVNRNSLAMELLLSDLDVPESILKILLEYNELFGDVTILDRAGDLSWNPGCMKAVRRLREVYDIICMYGYESYIRFDLGMVSHYDYYTGIIFQGYTYGTGDPIGKGGRYDHLLSRFGMDAPAIGFTILVDNLMSALWRQKINVAISDYGYTVFVYEKKDRAGAIRTVMAMREKGIKTELLQKDPDRSEKDYRDFVRSMGADCLIILDNDQVRIRNFTGRSTETKTLGAFREELS